MLTQQDVLALQVGQAVMWKGPANEYLCRVERNVMGTLLLSYRDEFGQERDVTPSPKYLRLADEPLGWAAVVQAAIDSCEVI